MRRLPCTALAAVLVAVVAGCGDRPVKPPDLTRLKPTTPKDVLQFPAAGVAFKAPRKWARQRTAGPPRVTTLYSGNSLVAVWAYPRTKEVLPRDPASFKAGRTRLLKEVHKRDPKFVVTSTEPRKIAGAPALQIVGRQTIARLVLLTRSVHVYKGHVEYVIEALAPPSQYAVTNGQVLTPLLESLKLTGKIRKRSKG